MPPRAPMLGIMHAVAAYLIAAIVAVTPARPALADDARSKLALAVRFEKGDGVPRDLTRALAAYCEAARMGNGNAAYAAGWMYLTGRGTQRDAANGLSWLRMAGRQGNAAAIRWLEQSSTSSSTRPTQPHCRTTQSAGASWQRGPYSDLIERAAQEAQIDPSLIHAVMAVESAFRADAVSPKQAKGLMQLTDDTARRFGVRDSFDPAQNIRGGARYLQWLLEFFDGDIALALAGYNAGEQAVVRYKGIPPYPETRAYVAKVKGRLTGGTGTRDLRATPAAAVFTPPPRPDPIAEIGANLGAARIF